MQITIPKQKEIPGQFYPLLPQAKHINTETYMYINLLLIISATDKKKIIKNNNNKNKKLIQIFDLSFQLNLFW